MSGNGSDHSDHEEGACANTDNAALGLGNRLLETSLRFLPVEDEDALVDAGMVVADWPHRSKVVLRGGRVALARGTGMTGRRSYIRDTRNPSDPFGGDGWLPAHLPGANAMCHICGGPSPGELAHGECMAELVMF